MTNVASVQLLIGDTAASVFTEAQIQAFLDMTASAGTEIVLAAAALACRSMATSAVLLAKAETIDGYSINRTAMAKDYLAMAATFTSELNRAPAVGVAEMSWTGFTLSEIMRNDALRDG